MKHAILLISSYGADYLNKNIKQFENDNDIDIYIHIHGKTLEEKNKIVLTSNVKICDNKFDSTRYSFEMVETMFYLLETAKITYEYDYYHFFSDHCYIHTTLQNFKEYFENNKKYSFINYWDNQGQSLLLNNNKTIILYKGSQWFSLYKDLTKQILDKKELINFYKNKFLNNEIIIKEGAIDEMVFQNIIIRDIFNENFEEINKYIINNNLRKIIWKNDRSDYFLKSNINNYNIHEIRKNSLIIRKIDFNNEDSWSFLEELKAIDEINYNKHLQLWCTSHLPIDEMKNTYNFEENENLKLFYTKDNMPGMNINKYAYEFGGFSAMYYVWKNYLKSDIVGFCEYRRYYVQNMIDEKRILENNEIQTYEGQIGFWHPRTRRYNTPIEWSLMFKYPTYIIYTFAKTLSKHLNKSLTEIFNDLSNVEKFKFAPGRQMFICKWETFDKIMTIYYDFLQEIMPKFEIGDNFEKYFDIECLLFNQRNNIGDLKPDSEQNFYWFTSDTTIGCNRRIPAYYGETFLGILVIYLSENVFKNVINYYVNIDDLINNDGFISNENRNKIFDFYTKSLYKGVLEFRIYTTKNIKINLGNYNYNNKYNKLGIIPLSWAKDYFNYKKVLTYDDGHSYEENIFYKYNINTNTFEINIYMTRGIT